MSTYWPINHRYYVVVTFAALACSLLAISSQSLWIDEAGTAVIVKNASFSEFWNNLAEDNGSTIQMPLYMLSLWGWEKIFGHSEFALRAMNIPLFLVAIGCVLYGLRLSFSMRVFFVLFACSSAFVWAYMDEARPYMMQFCAATLAMVPLVNIAADWKSPVRQILCFSPWEFLFFADQA